MKTRRLRVVVVTIAAMSMSLTWVACGEGQKVGSEKLLEFEEQQRGGPRLGEKTAAPDKTPSSLTVGGATKAPATATPAPRATPSYFDVTLVSNSPYYTPGNRIVIRKGVTLRVTNKDAVPERSKGRSFTDKHGTFHSGLLKPGQSWTWTFNGTGSYEVIDEGLNFATAILEVS